MRLCTTRSLDVRAPALAFIGHLGVQIHARSALSAHVFIPLTTSSQRMICCFVVHVRPKFRHLHPRHIVRCPGGLIGCAQAKRRVQPRPQRTARAATVAVHPCQSSQAPVHVLVWATLLSCTVSWVPEQPKSRAQYPDWPANYLAFALADCRLLAAIYACPLPGQQLRAALVLKTCPLRGMCVADDVQRA